MTDRSSPEDRITSMAGELLAFCLGRQGRAEEAGSLLGGLVSKNSPSDQLLLMGQMNCRQGKWEQALEHLRRLPEAADLDPEVRRRGSDWLLRAAVYFSEREEWGKTFECLSAARSLHGENPALRHIPEETADSLPVMYFMTGDYKMAIDLWHGGLKNNGYSPEKVHLLAIAHQCLVENGAEMTTEGKVCLLGDTHMYWTALSTDQNYWDRLFERRKGLYGPRVSAAEFKRVIPGVGIGRCETILNRIQSEAGSREDDAKTLQQVAEVRMTMSIELHSARLLADLRAEENLDWPGGGLRMLTSLWGRQRLDESLARFQSPEIGSSGWMLAGLNNSDFRTAVVHFMNGDYAACMQNAVESIHPSTRANGDYPRNLIGMAALRRAETALQTHNFQGCRDIAAMIGQIPDAGVRGRVENLLEELVSKRLQRILGREKRDEAVSFLLEVINKASAPEAEARVGLPKVRDILSGVFLQRSKLRQNGGDMDGFMDDYEQAIRYAADSGLCKKEFRKIVRDHLEDLFKRRNFKSIRDLMDRLSARYPEDKFLTARKYLYEALEKNEKIHDLGSDEVLGLLERAYEADHDDQEIVKTCAEALYDKAFSIYNDSIGLPAPERREALMRAEKLLKRALEININHENALSALNKVRSVMENLGV